MARQWLNFNRSLLEKGRTEVNRKSGEGGLFLCLLQEWPICGKQMVKVRYRQASFFFRSFSHARIHEIFFVLIYFKNLPFNHCSMRDVGAVSWGGQVK